MVWNMVKLLEYLAFRCVPKVGEVLEVFESYGLKSNVLGYGRCGDPIHMFRIGVGPRKILLIGFVDPDEPVGALALETLVTKVFDLEPNLLEEYAWYLIPVADPCGAKLNEEWFQDPYNARLYILERFKVKVVDWKLPGSCNGYVFNESTPEALAVKKAIDMVRPDIVVPLHNNDFSGLYFFLSKNIPELISALKRAANVLGIPMHRGEPEASYLEVFEKGFYREPTMCDEYCNCVEHSLDPRACIEGLGETIYGYAKRVNPNVFSIVCESPYIYSRVLEDSTPSGTRIRDLYLDMISSIAPTASYVESVVRKLIPHVDKDCPYLWEAEEYLLGWSSRLESLKRRVTVDERYEREASRAGEFDITVVRGLWSTLLRLGVALRLLKKCSVDAPRTIIENAVAKLINVFEDLYAELQHHYVEYIPLEKQVAIQLYTILLAIEYVHSENG